MNPPKMTYGAIMGRCVAEPETTSNKKEPELLRAEVLFLLWHSIVEANRLKPISPHIERLKQNSLSS